jgi:hypothetical protein
VTSGFGQKWKDFFRSLEAHDGLNINLDAHIWLLRHLFLPSINRDAEQWAATWNNHVLARRGQPHRTPSQMYLLGMIENGHRGIYVEPEPPADPDGLFADYGIDWDEIDNSRILQHHDNYNPPDPQTANPFVVHHPDQLSHVEVPDARCPFNDQQIAALDVALAALPLFQNEDMHSRRMIWIDALRIATTMVD